ncbi:hypothetical protein DV737_g242, partial [Chaetothyriales sp. CBS 132003]
MGKSKAAKAAKAGESVPHRHLHSRVSFLHQAATYLATSVDSRAGGKASVSDARHGQRDASDLDERGGKQACRAQSRHLISQLRGVSKKAQIRLAPDVKRVLCKRCDSLLLPGHGCVSEIENASLDRRKPWADVLCIKCTACGTVKRFPAGRPRAAKARMERKRDKAGQLKEVQKHNKGQARLVAAGKRGVAKKG